jgi:predicted 2-oxoglutarate/Fe(II)-dependent dioxygenase YbiX/peroxiredoxin
MVDITQQQPFALKGHIQRGDMAPWWKQGRYKFVFDPVAGRYIVLSFYQSAANPLGQAALHSLQDHSHFVDDGKAAFFGISADPKDQSELRIGPSFPSVQFIWDFDEAVNRAYGIGPNRVWIILDAMLRVIEAMPFRVDGSERQQIFDFLSALPPPSSFLGLETQAPILILANVFEPEFCRHLIDVFEQQGGRESGFMQEIAGKAVELYDAKWKRRKDCTVTDMTLVDHIKARVSRRVGTMMQRAFHFKLTRMERHLIACYMAQDGGHFGPHRDDTVKATEHRRFAVSINLNDDFDGGELSFPEFSPRGFKAPVGAALIFSSSLLHRVNPVTRGRRYAFLPFLHDEEAEKVREANLRFLSQPT